MISTTAEDLIPVSIDKQNENQHSQIYMSFLRNFIKVANSRVDLLYRFYSCQSKLFVSETPYKKNQPVEVRAYGSQEIRYLLESLFNEVKHELDRAVHQQTVKDHSLLLSNGALTVKDSDTQYSFTKSLVVDRTERGLVIRSETLQIHSEKANQSLLKKAKSKLESFRKDLALHFPQVTERKLRVKVQKSAIQETVVSQSDPTLSQTPIPESSRRRDEAKNDEFCEHGAMDSVPEVTPDRRRSNGRLTIEFPKSVSPLTLNCTYQTLPKTTQNTKPREMRLDTPLDDKPERKDTDVVDGNKLDLSVKCSQHEIESVESVGERLTPSGNASITMKPFLSLFRSAPVPDGRPMVWELSHDAVLTQLNKYRSTADKLNMEVECSQSSDADSQVPWNERTVFLDNLPRDVHPDSLRRAFETMFGEIEEENGIIICSASFSSIAYIVFKAKESAEAIRLSDSWIKGSKLIVQKYKSDFTTIESTESHDDFIVCATNNHLQNSSSRFSSTTSSSDRLRDEDTTSVLS
eukprot:g5832.t1